MRRNKSNEEQKEVLSYQHFKMIGFWQLVVVFLIIVSLFGAGKLPGAMSDIGKGIRNFRKALKDDKDKEDQNEK